MKPRLALNSLCLRMALNFGSSCLRQVLITGATAMPVPVVLQAEARAYTAS